MSESKSKSDHKNSLKKSVSTDSVSQKDFEENSNESESSGGLWPALIMLLLMALVIVGHALST